MRRLSVLVLVVLAACSGRSSDVMPVGGVSSFARETTAAPPAPFYGKLSRYNINPQKVFVAGISSGGFFAVQMDVAHSATFKGAAVYAGGVYHCAEDSVGIALAACGGEGQYESTLAASEAYLDYESSHENIDNESNLRGQIVYVWTGRDDTVVNPKEMYDLHAEYEHYGARVSSDSEFPAEHGWESPYGQVACGTEASPYMITCDKDGVPYDSEHWWLEQFLGALKPKNTRTLQGALINFDQRPFGASASNSMDTNGYLFVPKTCTEGAQCALVVAFHGCNQNQSLIGDTFVKESGIDEWADTNNVIVLYPYAIVSSTVPYNPQGCWDWWGYNDQYYSLHQGTQITIVYRMVQQLMGT